MSYTIIRVEKLKNAGNLRAALEHNTRERPCEKADPARTPRNEIVAGTKFADDALDAHAQIVEKLVKRKDSVQALEYVIACPPEAVEALDGPQGDPNGLYLKSALNWVSMRHGKAERVIHAAIHRDEKSPHIHIIVVPVAHVSRKGGNTYRTLSAKHFVGGKKKLAQLQTEFADQVGKSWGLERGISKEITGRFHRPVRDWNPARVMAIESKELDGLRPEELKTIILTQRQALITNSAFAGGQGKDPSLPPSTPPPLEKAPRPADPIAGLAWDACPNNDKIFGPRQTAAIIEYAKLWDRSLSPIKIEGKTAYELLGEAARKEASSDRKPLTVDYCRTIVDLIERQLDIEDALAKGRDDQQRGRPQGQGRG